jgi:hypothetical protein
MMPAMKQTLAWPSLAKCTSTSKEEFDMAEVGTEDPQRATAQKTDDESFHEFVKAARDLKEKFVDPRRAWYAQHKILPLLNSQWVGWRVKYGRQPGEANT